MEGAAIGRILIVIGAVLAAWALLFLFSGRMPPPPPETQIELERHTEKDREASRDVDS